MENAILTERLIEHHADLLFEGERDQIGVIGCEKWAGFLLPELGVLG
jgi:hypothetical protein